MYRKMAEEEDDKMAKRWQKDAQGILIFTGLFSAAVAALLAVTVLDLKQTSQDRSAFYLEQIYQFQVLADSNASRPSTPAKPPPFSAPKYAIWVNSLWFLSLAMSLTGALLAILQQQWARRYLRVTQPPRYTPHERARMREFFSNGVDKLLLPWAVEAVSTLIHISLSLFFTGLLIYLFNINHTVFLAVVWWVGVSGAIYVLITFMSIFRLDSPYRSPLSSPVCRASAGILFLAFGFLSFLALCWDTAQKWLHNKSNHFLEWVLRGMKKPTEMTVRESSSEIDSRILKWTFNALGEDQEFGQFFQHLLGFCSSKVVMDPQIRILHSLGELELSWALVGFLERTWLSNSVSESDKKQRFVMCVKVVDAACLHDAAWWIHNGTFEGDWYEVRRSVEMGLLLRRGTRGDQGIGLFAQSIVAQIIADVQGDNRDWVALATDQLGHDLTRYLQHGNNSVLLANLIHITRQIFGFSSGVNWKMANKTSDCILPSFPRFDVRSALPELQHDFCALWNSMVSDVQSGKNLPSAIWILVGIRHIYLDLHQGTDSAPTAFDPTTVNTDPKLCESSSYPLCGLSEHHSLVGDHATGRPAHSVASPTTPLDPTHTGTQPTSGSSSGGVPDTPIHPIPVATPHVTAIISSATLSPTIIASRDDGGDDGHDDEDICPTITPSAKALGKRPLVEGPDRLGVHNDTQDRNVPTQSEHPRNLAGQNYHSSDHPATREL
ncbi:hypothetical protein BJV78DRAFT_151817 [Lactifluus subvellereus]|nr:hypothetical protein BJV78DRAFT_151817 [Lactifluus subvellereus]